MKLTEAKDKIREIYSKSLEETMWINPNNLYDVESNNPEIKGSYNKLKASKVDSLIRLGTEGLLHHIINTVDSMLFQYFNNLLIANDGNHRAYAAWKIGITEIPMVYNSILKSDPERKLINISKFELLTNKEYQKFLELL